LTTTNGFVSESTVSGQRVTYEGSAGKGGEAGGALSGQIAFTAKVLQFEHPDGGFELPLDRLDVGLSAGGDVIFHDAATGWQIESDDERIWNDYFLRRSPRLRARVRELRARREGGRSLKYALCFLIAFVAVFFAGWLLAGAATGFIVGRIPLAWEEHLTDKVIAEHPKLFVIATNDAREAVVTQLVARIAAALPPAERHYQFRAAILDHYLVNAFALPGGRIFVFKGLLDHVQKPEELAGVLAHEMAHVTQRHGLRKLITARGPYYALRLFISNKQALLSAISAGSQLLVGQQYSRGMEHDADTIGWHYLIAANIDPRGMADFFRHQEAEDAADYIPQMLRSHPAASERIAWLDKLWDDSPHQTNFVSLPALTNAPLSPLQERLLRRFNRAQ
jgi:Zn-dependent protease with chaperone function